MVDPASVERQRDRSQEWVPGCRSGSRRVVSIIVGAICGMLAGFFLTELGLGGILGDLPLQLVVFVSALVGMILAFLGRLDAMIVIDAILLGFFILIADTPIMAPAAAAWVRGDTLPSRADAIVVLSSGINSAGMLNEQSVSRLLTGLELFQRGIAPRLITTEISAKFGDVTRTSAADRERLVTLGGATAGWSFVSGVQTTRDEATQTAAQLGAGKMVVVVTSPIHTRRACATFEGAGLKVACVPSREQDYATWHPRTARDRLEAFRQYMYERLGMVKYRAKGWVSNNASPLRSR